METTSTPDGKDGRAAGAENQQSWNIALLWANGTSTTTSLRGTLMDACNRLHQLTLDPIERAGRRPLMGIIGDPDTGTEHPCRISHYRADGSIGDLEPRAFDEGRPLTAVHVVVGATEPSGETLDWLDDTACRSYPQGVRRHEFVRKTLRPHDDTPRYYFLRQLALPTDESGTGEPSSRPRR